MIFREAHLLWEAGKVELMGMRRGEHTDTTSHAHPSRQPPGIPGSGSLLSPPRGLLGTDPLHLQSSYWPFGSEGCTPWPQDHLASSATGLGQVIPAGSYLENEAAGLLALRLSPIHLWTDLYGGSQGAQGQQNRARPIKNS